MKVIARALCRFTVTVNRLRLRVRLLPSTQAVHRSFHGGSCAQDRRQVHAYFERHPKSPRCFGSVVLGANGRLFELVPHEVAHAVRHYLVRVEEGNDERHAYLCGLLTARILTRLQREGYLTNR